MTTATRPFTVVGQSVGQIEGRAKVSGRAVYSADVHLPGTLWCKVLRSPYPHARILRIDTSKAEALTGVHAVITAKDVPNVRMGRGLFDMPLLAMDKAVYMGERVAAVAADSKLIAEEALDLIEVEYEELQPVCDPLEAMRPDAPIIHPDILSYTSGRKIPDTPNTHEHAVRTRGDIEQGFAGADHIFEHTVYTQAHHPGHLEPHVAMVNIEDDGSVHIWEAIKNPIVGKKQLAELTGLPMHKIVFHIVHIGADFGGKGAIWDSAVCYYLAKKTGRPVKVVWTYTEELIAAGARCPGVLTMRTGVKKDGTITAHHSRAVFDTGAYSANLPSGAPGGGLWAAGVYRVPHVKFENIGVYTNNMPKGHVRAPGAPQIIFALETHFDIIARELGIDPVEFRMRNLIESGEQTALGEPFHDLHAKETLQAAAKLADWGAPKSGPRRGRGLAMYDRHTGAGVANAELTVDGDGRAVLYTAGPDTGTGAHTIMAQIVAEELTLPLGQVAVRTASGFDVDAGVGANRVTHIYGQAALQAAQKAREELALLAGELLSSRPEGGALPEPVEGRGAAVPSTSSGNVGLPAGPRGAPGVSLEGGSFRSEGRLLPLPAVAAEAAARAGGEFRVRVTYDGNRAEGVTTVCTQIAEVEVDPETGQVKILSMVSAHDVGAVLNPMNLQAQVEGSLVYGLGYALTEELLIEDGKVTNPNLGEYKLPNIRDIPPLKSTLVQGAVGPGPYGAKSIAEGGNVATAAAIANAVYDACGVRVNDLPVTAEKVYQGLKGKRG